MEMHVVRDASARAFAQIHAGVIALGMISGFQSRLGLTRQNHHLLKRLVTQFRETCHMGIRSYQNVTCGVGVEIQEDEIQASPIQDVALAVARGIPPRHVTKWTSIPTTPLADILITPGAPQVIHRVLSCPSMMRAPFKPGVSAGGFYAGPAGPDVPALVCGFSAGGSDDA